MRCCRRHHQPAWAERRRASSQLCNFPLPLSKMVLARCDSLVWLRFKDIINRFFTSGRGGLCWWRSYLVVIAHESSPGVLGPQEAVDEHGPAQREVEADVLLEVTAQLVTGQVITEAETLPRNQFVYLLSDRAGQQRLKTLCTHTDSKKFSVCQDQDDIFRHIHFSTTVSSVTSM